MTIRWSIALSLALAATGVLRADKLRADELLPPVHIEAAGKPIDIERVGHSAPFVGDVDGDGVRDLLVGEYFEGRLRIYKNLGTDSQPRFERHTWLAAGGQDARVPEG